MRNNVGRRASLLKWSPMERGTSKGKSSSYTTVDELINKESEKDGVDVYHVDSVTFMGF